MDIEFKFIGWNNSTEPNGKKHDKVWTAFSVNGVHYGGWGARGKSLSFKKYSSSWEQRNKIEDKELTYNKVDEFILFAMFPNFEAEVSQRLLFCVLANKVK